MKLVYNEFNYPSELCDFVNDNDNQINVHGITIDSFGKFILFYSENKVTNTKGFDADEFYKNFRNK